MKYKGIDGVVTRTQPLDAPSSASGKSRKVEFDYHRYYIGNSQQMKTNVPANFAPANLAATLPYFKDVAQLGNICTNDSVNYF